MIAQTGVATRSSPLRKAEMSDSIALDELRGWIGKRDCETDVITPELVKRFRATLCGYAELGPDIPLGIHWCLALPALPQDALGPDGHPATGGFLPLMPSRRRMWAGSRVNFHGPLAIDVPIERTSTIADVVFKEGATSGPLVFVSVKHQFFQAGTVCVEELQTIVYRQPSPFKKAQPAQAQDAVLTRSVTPNSTLMFRYSAVTFNGHRIHYDHSYATHTEGYPGLVVHGPLTATLLMNLAQSTRPQNRLKAFEFRGAAPAFVDQALKLLVLDEGAKTLEARAHEGTLIMAANATF
jgi:3-methylfumaryl-CoA hydratase